MVSDEECLQKKSKLLARELESNHFHCLLDELLLEILCRLPCKKSAVQCKSVCKRWAALISSPYFIGRFIADKKRKQLETFCTLLRSIRSRRNDGTWSGLTMYLRDPHFNLNKMSFSSLPSFKGGDPTAFTVYASCNDLLLYSKLDELGKQYYYICNIQTEQWLLLPMPPLYYRCCVAFTCDPYYYYYYDHEQTDDDISSNKIILNPAYRYSIIVVGYRGHPNTMMTAHLFSNTGTTSEWRDIVLSLPKPCLLRYPNPGFVFEGKLHFVCDQGVIGFDPYDEDGNTSGVFKCHLIDWPAGIYVGSQFFQECFQEYQGRLHLFMQLYNDQERLQMWCLKNYKTSEWSLQHNITMQEWIIRDEQISSTYVNKCVSLGLLVGLHPTHPDVFYLRSPDWIVVCNLSTRTLEIASPIDARAARLLPGCLSFRSMLPVWPTPLPALS